MFISLTCESIRSPVCKNKAMASSMWILRLLDCCWFLWKLNGNIFDSRLHEWNIVIP